MPVPASGKMFSKSAALRFLLHKSPLCFAATGVLFVFHR